MSDQGKQGKRGERGERPELVFRGKVAVWYQALCAVIAAVAAILALQTTLPVFVPILALVAGGIFLFPIVVRNRVELYVDRLEIFFGWSHVVISYARVRDVQPLTGGCDQFTGHMCAAELDGVFIEAPQVGDAAVSVTDNDALIGELRRRAGLGEQP